MLKVTRESSTVFQETALPLSLSECVSAVREMLVPEVQCGWVEGVARAADHSVGRQHAEQSKLIPDVRPHVLPLQHNTQTNINNSLDVVEIENRVCSHQKFASPFNLLFW
jgi:hypothetical protein